MGHQKRSRADLPFGDARMATREWANGCHGKVRHTSKKQAEGCLRVMRKDPRTRPSASLNTYKCRMCGNWHIGNRYKDVPKEVSDMDQEREIREEQEPPKTDDPPATKPGDSEPSTDSTTKDPQAAD